MAARAHAVDAHVPAFERRAEFRTKYGIRRAELRRPRRRAHVLDAADARGAGDYWAGGGEAVALLRDHRRRRVPRAARLRPGGQGSDFHRLERSAHAGRPRLAARLASQARSPTIAALQALAHAR